MTDDNGKDDDSLSEKKSTILQTANINSSRLISIIGDEDTCVGFLIAGIGEENNFDPPNYFITDPKTDAFKIEKVFLDFIHRRDIGLILITKEAAEKISLVLKKYITSIDPTILVIPGHNGPFDIDLPIAVEETVRLSIIRRISHSSRRSHSSTNSSRLSSDFGEFSS